MDRPRFGTLVITRTSRGIEIGRREIAGTPERKKSETQPAADKKRPVLTLVK